MPCARSGCLPRDRGGRDCRSRHARSHRRRRCRTREKRRRPTRPPPARPCGRGGGSQHRPPPAYSAILRAGRLWPSLLCTVNPGRRRFCTKRCRVMPRPSGGPRRIAWHDIYGRSGQAASRQDRRRHDGVQGRAHEANGNIEEAMHDPPQARPRAGGQEAPAARPARA